MTLPPDLTTFGWSTFFQSQLSLEDLTETKPVRIMAVHRGAWDVANPDMQGQVTPPAFVQETPATVGDWVLLDVETGRVVRLLERSSLFQRRAAGVGAKLQLIASNVDTVCIVSSCNDDFNLARLERYLVIAQAAGATPVIVLTKADLSDDPSPMRQAAEHLLPGLVVDCVDARDSASVAVLKPWCGIGQTVALLGSSGVGKSTLVNTLTGSDGQETSGIREDDSKGRHTTTGRSLHRLEAGGWLLDTPGMRELQLADVAKGVNDVFADITGLAAQCKFTDCGHSTEPGCAVQTAVASGALDMDRLQRFQKLQAEEAFNTLSVAERRARDKSFGKMIKGVKKEMKRRGK